MTQELLTDESLSRKIITKGFWLYFFGFLVAPLGYIIKIFLSQDLSVSELGILYSVISLVIMVSAYNDIGMTQSLNYFVPRFITENKLDKVKSIIVYSLIMQMLTGMTIALFFFFGADFLSSHYFRSPIASQLLKIFAVYFLGYNIFQTISTFFLSIQNTFFNKIIDFIKVASTLFFILFLYFYDYGDIVSYSYARVIGLYSGIMVALGIFFFKFYKPYFYEQKIIWSMPLIKEIAGYALFVFLGSQASTVLGQIDMQMILYYLGNEAAGYYTNYLSILGIANIIIGPLLLLLFPLFSQLHVQQATKKLRLLKNTLADNFFIISIAFSVFFFVFAQAIAIATFGHKFILSGSILQYSLPFLVFNFLMIININMLSSIGKVKERVKVILITIILNIITNYIFIHTIGIEGAALATGIGRCVMRVISELYLRKEYPISFDVYSIIKNIFIFGIIGMGLYIYIIPFFSRTNRRNTLYILAGFSIIYLGILLLVNYKKLHYLINEIRNISKK